MSTFHLPLSSSNQSTPVSNSATFDHNKQDKPKAYSLKKLETKLKQEVDADFFQDPQQFRALPRVIDVLGAQLLDVNDDYGKKDALSNKVITATNHPSNQNFNLPSESHHKSHFDNLHKNNPAYSSLRKQQEIIEHAIEHLTVTHYNELNTSVVAVGHVSKRFGEAVGQVKGLRRQVQEIRENLANASVGGAPGQVGGSDINNNAVNDDNDEGNENKTGDLYQLHPLGGKSLRELWLKKLECEAVLSLLQKLEVIRKTPSAFDALVHSQPCRIGAAVVLLSDAITTMFKKDVTQIQALHKITEQLMSRKQKAEEVLWETLQDVLYLRTGNSDSFASNMNDGGIDGGASNSLHALDLNIDGTVKSSGSDPAGLRGNSRKGYSRNNRHMFVSTHTHRRNNGEDSEGSDSDESDLDSISVSTGDRSSKKGGQSNDSDNRKRPAMRKGMNTSILNPVEGNAVGAFANFHDHQGRLLPRAMIESELDVEADELRCLENWRNSPNENTAYSSYSSDATLILPRYTDPVLALRILIEALAKLGRLDDVERYVAENLDREIRRIAQLEQANTLSKLEKYRTKTGSSLHRRNANPNANSDVAEERLKVFKAHLRALLKGFGSVMLRLTYLAQILRHRISSDPTIVTPSYTTPSSALHSALVSAAVTMQREMKGFLHACLDEDKKHSLSQDGRIVTPAMMDGNLPQRDSRPMTAASNISANEQGIFSLGIISDASLASSVREKFAQNVSLASRSSAMKMTAKEYVLQVLCPRTGTVPQIRHALLFRRSIALWSKECEELKKELAIASKEDTSTPVYNATTEETALDYLDRIVQKSLLPMLQDVAVNGTVAALERPDAFDPITSVGLYNSTVKGQKLKVEMCAACQGLYVSTGPLFSALHRLPRGGEKAEMYSSMVAVLEHAILTFISRVKQRISYLCDGKTAFELLEDKNSRQATALSLIMEARKPFSQLLTSYFDNDALGLGPSVDTPTANRSIKPIAPSSSDTRSRNLGEEVKEHGLSTVMENNNELQREQECFENEVGHLSDLLNFIDPAYGKDIKRCPEEDFLKAVSFAHSLLKLSSQLEKRLKPRKEMWGKSYHAPRTLRDSIKNIRMHGIRVAKFCRMELMLQTVKKMSTIYSSSAINAREAVRLPSSVNDLGEYLASMSDLLREYGGNKIAAYSLSSLEQYIPLFLMETVRIIAVGDGLPSGFKVTLNGVESLDRSCSVLYRDLKGATSFENSFWDDEVAADAFERAASYVSLMELDMEELIAYFRDKRDQFTESDYKTMFSMNGPRRKGDIYMFEQSRSYV